MISFLHEFSGPWAAWIVAASWQIAVLVCLIAFVALLGKRLPARIRFALWLLVLLKVFLPPSLTAVWSVGHWGIQPLLDKAEQVKSLTHTVEAVTFSVPLDPAVLPASLPVSEEAAPEIPTESPHRSHWTFAYALLCFWGSGLLVFVAVILRHYVGFAWKLQNAEEVDEGPLQVEIERLALCLAKQSPPRLLLSEQVKSPFLFGLLRPRIVLPPNLLKELDQRQLRDVLLHEMIHWKRRDLWVGWVQVLAQALFWFHPLVWLANYRLRHERECACDEAVLALDEREPKAYGESLLKVLLAAKGQSSAALGFLGIFERNTRLQSRLEDIMNYPSRTRKTGIWGWGLVALLAMVFLPMAGVETIAEDQQENREESVQYFVRFVLGEDKITFEGKEVPLQEVGSLLAKVPDPSNTVVELATVREIRFDQLTEDSTYRAIASQLKGSKFKFTSFIGKHSLGSIGSIPLMIYPAPTREDYKKHNCIIQYHVRLVVGEDKMTFEGQETTLEELALLLERVPNKPNTVFQYSTTAAKRPDTIGKDTTSAAAAAQSDRYGFKYFSYAGSKPLGTPGDRPRIMSRNPAVIEALNRNPYIVSFRPIEPFQPQSAKELLGAFNEDLPRGIRTHHFRTRPIQGTRVGHICVDGRQGSEKIRTMLQESKKLAVLEIQRAEDKHLEGLFAMNQQTGRIILGRSEVETTVASEPDHQIVR